MPETSVAATTRLPLDAESSKLANTAHAVHVALSVEVWLAIMYPLIGLLPPDAPLQVRMTGSVLYMRGAAETLAAGCGGVFFRTEFVDIFQPE